VKGGSKVETAKDKIPNTWPGSKSPRWRFVDGVTHCILEPETFLKRDGPSKKIKKKSRSSEKP